MNTRELRREPRFPISRRGELTYNGTRFPCLIYDISNSGIGIICARDPAAGQALELRFELSPDQYYQCKIKIKYIDNGCLGSEIIEVDQNAAKMYRRFIQQHAEDLSNKLEKPLKRVRTECSRQTLQACQ